jgi:hypothetical protein
MGRSTSSSALGVSLLLLVVTMAGTSAPVSAAETFVATASLKTAAGTAVTAPVEISVTHWATDGERDRAVAALKDGGQAAFKAWLDAAPAAGTIQVGDRRATLRFARAVPTEGGRIITVIASQPLVHIGAGLSDAPPRAGYHFAVALFEIGAGGRETIGDFAPAAKLTVRSSDSFEVEDYGAEAVRLTRIATK